ncbi:hypothetical protein QBC38DRAFT_248816 [Podospora fimiseda]|uniref:Uncharacterized protein n=1 Tax=Podospora fimiseda TaxID=252190 RepID=A0AAN7H033_9PEZI|nr:hypothetical protein QBC38DRAFT_248816 [Podospora fimiseda]
MLPSPFRIELQLACTRVFHLISLACCQLEPRIFNYLLISFLYPCSGNTPNAGQKGAAGAWNRESDETFLKEKKRKKRHHVWEPYRFSILNIYHVKKIAFPR